MLPIIYASASGNVEIVCEKVAEILNDHNIANDLMRAEVTPINVIEHHKLFVLATSTWKHGEINPYFDQLYTDLAKIDCAGKRAAFIGLGDVRYEPVLFCEGMKVLKQRFINQGGEEIFRPMMLNGEPYQYLDIVVKNWTLDMIKEL